MKKIEIALTYASWGWHVLPVVPNGKSPATAHGVNDATTNQEQIIKWWKQNPNFNIGVACGAKSNLIVFDIDPRNGGDLSWEDWLIEHGHDSIQAYALTAGGGAHYLAEYTDQLRSCKMAQGIDLLSDGKYFLAPGSEIEGKQYQWGDDPADGYAPMIIPSDWIQAINNRDKISRDLSTGEKIIEGARNEALTQLAGFMRNGGISEAEILAALQVANETRLSIPLPSSEVLQIVKSICRYEPDSDVLHDTSIGNMIADSILNSPKTGFYLTRGNSLISQPSPLPWILKRWLPEKSSAMIYGPSGSGKTFVALDMALSIATGHNWGDIQNKSPGIVVYLAGEGNYGMRSRMASWAMYHGHYNINNILVSNQPIELDSPNAHLTIINAVKELTDEPIKAIFIDTLNRHMGGDENSGKDISRLINACNVVSLAFDATTVLIHHTGHGEGAKNRERGSSVLRASLDTSIHIYKEGGDITIKCRKMKDAIEPNPIKAKLIPVDLGWYDEDGESILGGALEYSESESDDLEHGEKIELMGENERNCKYAMELAIKEVQDLDVRYTQILKHFESLEYNEGEKDNTIKQRFKRGIKRLRELGEIKRTEEGNYILDGILAPIIYNSLFEN